MSATRCSSAQVVFAAAMLVSLVGCDSSDDAAPLSSADAPAEIATTIATSTTTSSATTAVSTTAVSTTAGSASTTSAAPLTCVGDPTSDNERVDVESPDGPRSYLVATPAEVEGRVLVINLHGHGGSAVKTSANTGLVSPATAVGFVVVTPEGLGDPARWNFDRQAGEPDDYEFMRRLIGDLLDRYCVDTGLVALVGTSNGAAFAGLYGCRDERVVAIAMVIATAPETCDDGRRVPSMLTIRGDADPVVPYDSAQARTATWAAGAGCSDSTVSTEVWSGVERDTYPGCDDGQVIAIDTIAGGIHAWPGSPQPRPDNSEAGTTYPAAEQVIDFIVRTTNR